MDTPILEEASYDIAYDMSEHFNSTDVNVPCLSEDDTPLGKESEDAIQKKDDATISNNEFPDHTGIPMEEIPYVGLRFDSLQRAQEFNSNYAKKVGFVTRIRNINFDKTKKELKVPINQTIHCSREGYRESRVKAATWVKRITTAGCKARMYVMLDRQNDNWLVSKLELKHTHTCSAEQVVHYSEYRKLTMLAKCVIQNDEAGIRPNKTYLALANEVVGHQSLLCMFGFYFTRFQPPLSSDDCKRGDCLVRGVTQEGDLFLVTVNEQYLLYGEPRSWKYSVEFDPKTHKVRYECKIFGSSGLDQLRSKLLDYRANLVSRRVPTTQNSTVTQRKPALGESDIQDPSKVSTKGRPRMKRLRSELNTSIKKSMRRKKKNPLLEVDQAVNQVIVGFLLGKRMNHRNMAGSCPC
ncbi:hypothetical protein Ahy_B06g082262 [Arachis hypogaea]|uniref:FAR1 domain-containing protein n=1 Tax=Arachis hypogaea TaxID=3818 RepID=A0A444YN43_ARAHY|nr:hypothetical protein Ahy_B06g082262 [Arachis hypogaea]